METLPCMGLCYDGSHWGVSDLYDKIQEGIQEALNRGPEYEWTTDWWSSKKEIVCGKLTCENGKILVEVSCSDDFDTPGYANEEIPHTTELEIILEKLRDTWDEAHQDKRDNELYVGYSVLTERDCYAMYIGGEPQGEPVKRQAWVETYIKPAGDGYCLDGPPGDNYFEWGFQGETCMDEETKQALSEWAEENDEGEFTYGEYTIKPWRDE